MANPPEIYLDHNATAPILPAAAQAVLECGRAVHGNPGSQHAAGRAARGVLYEASDRVAELLGASTGGRRPDRLILTSGGTESNNLALRSLLPVGNQGAAAGANTHAAAVDAGATPSPHLVISAIEHPSVDATADLLAAGGVAVDRAPVDENGVTSADAVLALVRPETRLVSVMLANNETGAVQPVAEIARRCAARGVPVHTDATQAVGKTPVDFAGLGVAMLTFTAHKFHGPAGVGGLLVRGDLAGLRLLAGQAGYERPGTPAVPLAAGMRAALDAWHEEAAPRERRMATLRDRFESRLAAAVPGLVVVASAAPRLPHTSNLAFVGHNRQALQMAFDRAGVACSTGSACASGSSEPSPVLMAMGLPAGVVDAALRFSLGAQTTAAEIDDAATRIAAVCARLPGGARVGA
ncbi:MAG: cysteine desulfurase family protein [Planctomycetota bacterium]